MSFLTKVGTIINTGVKAVSVLGPTLAPIGVSDTFVQIAHLITTIEAAGQAINAKGADKLLMAAPVVSQIVLQSDLMIGKNIADPKKFQTAVAGIASNMADLLNSISEANIETVQK